MGNVVFDQTSKAVAGTFKGFLEMEQHQAIGNEMLKEAESKKSSKLIVDTAELSVIRKETQQWIEEDWFPRAIKIGIRYMAFVVSKMHLEKCRLKQLTRKQGLLKYNTLILFPQQKPGLLQSN